MGPKREMLAHVSGVATVGPVVHDPRSIPEVVLEAVEAALADANLTYDDIDAVVTASVDLFDGLTASNIAVTEVVGAVMKPETRIAADGLCAFIHGVAQVCAGAYKTVLVVAHSKPSLSNFDDITLWAMEPVFSQSLGLDFKSAAGLQAANIAAQDKDAVHRWAELVSARRAAASGGIAGTVSVQEVLDSEIIASPLRKEMVAPFGDGACAVVLSKSDLSHSNEVGVVVSGVGHDLAPHALGDRNLTRLDGLTRACNRAYGIAGIEKPSECFDLAEPSAIYPHEEELFASAAGFGPAVSLSPGGGLFAGHVPVAAGLTRLVDCVRFIRSNSDCHRAMAHGAWGPAGQGQAVTVLERMIP